MFHEQYIAGGGGKSTYEKACTLIFMWLKEKETLEEEYFWDVVLIGETDTELEE